MVERLRRIGVVKANGEARKLRTNSAKAVVGRPFEKGNPGKAKGTISKLTREVKEVYHAVFERMGGEDELFRWATQDDQHQTIFYVGMYSKLLPLRMTVDGQLTVTAENALRRIDQLLSNNKVIDVTPARSDTTGA
jgi:hypothetical protein